MLALTITIFLLAGIITGVIYSPFFEWKLHKDVMHTRRKITWKWLRKKPRLLRFLNKVINFSFIAHAVIHHGIFGGNHTYHAGPDSEDEKSTIPMAWYHGIVLVSFASSPWWV